MKIYFNYNENNISSIKNYNLYKLYLQNTNSDFKNEKINESDYKSFFNLNYMNIQNYNICLPYLLGKNNIEQKCVMYIDVDYKLIKDIKNIKKMCLNKDKLFYYCLDNESNIRFLLIHTDHPKFKDIDIIKLHNINENELKNIIFDSNKSIIVNLNDNEIFYDKNKEKIKKNLIINNLNSIEKKKLNFIRKNKILYVTSFNKKLYDVYGKKFLSTFNFEGDLILFSEDDMNFVTKDIKIKYNLFIGNLFGFDKSFFKFCKRNEKRNIQDAALGFRFNAIRFSYKVFSLINAYKYFKNDKYELMIWLDGDMIFKKELNSEYALNKLYDKNTLLSYLGRKNGRCYSECGFLVFNLKHAFIKRYLYEIRDCYLNDKIYELDEWHDSYIWDYFRIKYEMLYNIKNFNITSRFGCEQNVNHIITETPLIDYLDHLKGDIRKEIKTSANQKLYKKIKKQRDAENPDKQNDNESINNEKKEKLFDIIKRQIRKKIKMEKSIKK